MVDILNLETGTWASHSLERSKINHAGLALGKQLFIIGGITNVDPFLINTMNVFTDETVSSFRAVPEATSYPFLFPNPAGGQVQANLPDEMKQEGRISIFSNTGRLRVKWDQAFRP